MELNAKQCKEIIIDFRKGKTNIPQLKIYGQSIARVKSHKLLEIWLDDGLKWSMNTEYITKKAAKWLYLLKVLKKHAWCVYRRPKSILLCYCTVNPRIRCARVWHGNVTQEQSKNIERIQKDALYRMI